MIEVTTKFVTTCDDLPAAWAFVMEHIDRVGPDPSIHIGPVWSISVGEVLEGRDSENPPRHFEVAVSGMVQHEKEATDV